MTTCIRCFVSGKVQGVWFRGNTQQQAQALGISGYACNLADGRVEVLACGTDQALAALREWLWQGPPGARVADVVCGSTDGEVPGSFTTG